MAEGKKSFIIYVSWKRWLDGLSKEQKGIWLDWMMDYTNDLNPEYPKDQAVMIACMMAQDQLKRDLKKYELKVESIKRARELKETNNTNNEINMKSSRNHTEISSVNDNVNVNVNDNVLDKSNKENNITMNSNIKEKSTTSRFIPPSLEEVRAYCDERRNLVNPENFVNFYESKGWMVGKNKMKDWKAAVRTWEKEAGFKSEEEDNPNGGFRQL